MKVKPMSRRAVLRGLGGTILSLPFLDAMSGPFTRRAHAQTETFPKRFVVWYTPNGTVPANFWPSRNGSDSDFSLSPILEPLQRHKEDLLVLEGIDMLSSLSGPGDAHQKGTGQCLTATELQQGSFPGDAGLSAGWADNISADQVIANQIGNDTNFRSLEFGVAVQGSGVRSRISYTGAAKPLPPTNNPADMFIRMFGDPSISPEERMRIATRRQVVLDAIVGEYATLRGQLGSEDRYKMETHLESVQSIQDRLSKAEVQLGGNCQMPELGDIPDPDAVINMPEIGKLQMDLMAMAFACDLTRVASLMWSQSTAGHVYSFVNEHYPELTHDIREGHHSLAHKSDTDTPKVEQNTYINRWHSEQLAYFVDKLKAIPEGSGSVFDNTVIFWTNEQSKGNNHDRRNMPYVILGNGGGYFRTGRYITQNSETGHNRLLISLMNSMGVDIEEFGNVEYGSGALTGLES